MPVLFEILEVGKSYDRPTLAHLWGINGFQALGRGVFTPKNTKFIVLFVTREKQQCLTQYNDFLKDDLLFWEGENRHGNDNRIAEASQDGYEIHLFYREKHHSDFTYYGRLILTHCKRYPEKPSEFVFKVVSLSSSVYEDKYSGISEVNKIAENQDADETAYKIAMTEVGLNSIDKEVITKSRGLGQRLFRGSLFKLWQGECAVTGTQNPDVLRASHIKPWKCSELNEKLDPFNGLLLVPNFDTLLDTGLISFEDSGQIIISKKLKEKDCNRLNVHRELHLRRVSEQSLPYLNFHRSNRFRP
ncbi:MAG: HNH endonuclease [Victivallales bacterium]|jgi:hypothetical protein